MQNFKYSNHISCFNLNTILYIACFPETKVLSTSINLKKYCLEN